jgi:hypothetical protein
MDVFQSAAHGATATVEGNGASGAIALRAVYEEAPSLSSGVPWVRLHAQIAEEAPLALTFCVDGSPVDQGDVFAGAEQRHVPLDGSPLDLASLAAPPRTLDDSSFPGRFAVYVWYVSPEDTKAPREILPETQQMLQALGYLE